MSRLLTFMKRFPVVFFMVFKLELLKCRYYPRLGKSAILTIEDGGLYKAKDIYLFQYEVNI